MTAAQRAELPEEEDVTAADRLIVELPSDTGLIVMRALAPEPGLMPVAQTRPEHGRPASREPLPRSAEARSAIGVRRRSR